MNKCTRCGSLAINHGLHGRDGTDPDLCDVCYWRKRAEIKPTPNYGRMIQVCYELTEGYTYKEVGLKYGFSPERAAQIFAKVVRITKSPKKVPAALDNPCTDPRMSVLEQARKYPEYWKGRFAQVAKYWGCG